MVEMTHSPSTTSLGVAYNAFLFAHIGNDTAATPLSTLSALARLDIDPWREASELTGLPRDSAVRRLADLLARLPGRPEGLTDIEATARRLVALLPGKIAVADRGPAQAVGRAEANEARYVVIGFGLAIGLLLAGFLNASGADEATGRSGARPPVESRAPLPVAPQTILR